MFTFSTSSLLFLTGIKHSGIVVLGIRDVVAINIRVTHIPYSVAVYITLVRIVRFGTVVALIWDTVAVAVVIAGVT